MQCMMSCSLTACKHGMCLWGRMAVYDVMGLNKYLKWWVVSITPTILLTIVPSAGNVYDVFVDHSAFADNIWDVVGHNALSSGNK